MTTTTWPKKEILKAVVVCLFFGGLCAVFLLRNEIFANKPPERFGALIALIGLAAVAALVVRRH